MWLCVQVFVAAILFLCTVKVANQWNQENWEFAARVVKRRPSHWVEWVQVLQQQGYCQHKSTITVVTVLFFCVCVSQGPSCWDDILLPGQISGVCQSDFCSGSEAVRKQMHFLLLPVMTVQVTWLVCFVSFCLWKGVLYEVCLSSNHRWRPVCGPGPHHDQHQGCALHRLHWHHVTLFIFIIKKPNMF